jgi:exopolyphosphatase/guanosine-5'-triphosphate,3'-diphosphate pyrophosphatase
MEQIAGLDVGSNSVKLLVVEGSVKERTPQEIFEKSIICRLSEGLAHTGLLSHEAMNRTVEAVSDLLLSAGLKGEIPVKAVVTAPGRRASNGNHFIELLYEKTGVEAAIITVEEEASLSLLATRCAFPDSSELLVVDLGGASTEFVYSAGETSRVVSIPVGAVWLTEKFLTDDPPSPSQILEAQKSAADYYREAAEKLKIKDHDKPGLDLVLVSGSARALWVVERVLTGEAVSSPHGRKLSSNQVEMLCLRLREMHIREIKQLSHVNPARADLLLGGTLLLGAILEQFGEREMKVSAQGVSWGLIRREWSRNP